MPETITLLGQAGDEDDEFDEKTDTWNYQKGHAPRNLAVSPLDTRGCDRSLYASYKVTVDDPVDVTCDSSKSNSSSFASATEKLTLRVGNFYKNGKAAPILQIKINNNNTWTDIRSVSPNEVVYLSYDEIAGKLNVNFEDLFGQRLSFRVLKTFATPAKPAL